MAIRRRLICKKPLAKLLRREVAQPAELVPPLSTRGFAHHLKSLPQQLAHSWSARGGRAPLKES